MIPKLPRKTIGELQHEYLSNLKISGAKLTLVEAYQQVNSLNRYSAWWNINLKV